METIRVLLADDHAMFREGLRATLDRQSDITIVGEAEDGVEATKKASELAPDIVLMDINMPLTRRGRSQWPHCSTESSSGHHHPHHV